MSITLFNIKKEPDYGIADKIEKLHTEKGDILVVKLPPWITEDQRREISERLEGLLKDDDLVVLLLDGDGRSLITDLTLLSDLQLEEMGLMKIPKQEG